MIKPVQSHTGGGQLSAARASAAGEAALRTGMHLSLLLPGFNYLTGPVVMTCKYKAEQKADIHMPLGMDFLTDLAQSFLDGK